MRRRYWDQAAAFFRFASSLASTRATTASSVGWLRPFCLAMSCTSLSARSILGAPFCRARAAEAVQKVAQSLGRAIAGLVNTLNPERVLLGGSFGRVLEMAEKPMQDSLEHYVLDAPGETVLLCQPGLESDSALIGAAEVAFAQLLADPLGGRALAAR